MFSINLDTGKVQFPDPKEYDRQCKEFLSELGTAMDKDFEVHSIDWENKTINLKEKENKNDRSGSKGKNRKSLS